jgi:hypothetical protein
MNQTDGSETASTKVLWAVERLVGFGLFSVSRSSRYCSTPNFLQSGANSLRSPEEEEKSPPIDTLDSKE